MLRQHFTAILVGCCLASCASAQTNKVSVPYPPAQTLPDSRPYSWFLSPATTAAEGWLRGWADLYRGVGEWARNVAEAHCFEQTAYQQALANRKYRIEQYYELRFLNKEFHRKMRSASKPPRVTVPAAKQVSIPVAPRGLSAMGHVEWPLVLKSDSLATARKTVESVLVRRSAGAYTGMGTKDYRRARLAINELLADLKTRLHQMAPMEYTSAKRLLTDLKVEIIRGERPVLYSQN